MLKKQELNSKEPSIGIPNKKLILLFGGGFLFLFIGLVTWIFLVSPFTFHTLIWVDYQNKDGAPIGYLYELHNATENIGVYISSETQISSQDYEIADGWSLSFHSVADVWNPRVCSVTPSAIASNGDIFMLGTTKNSNSSTRDYDSSLLMFEKEESKITGASINNYKYWGEKLFLNSVDEPFYFAMQENELYTYTLNPSSKKLKKKFISSVKESERVRVTRDIRDFSPIIGIYDTQSLADKKYNFQNGSLIEFSDTEETASSSTSREEVTSTHRYGITSTFVLGSPYETKVFYKQKKILEFKKEAKIYSFIIGSYSENNKN